MENLLVKNQEILLTIKKIGINGEGIGYYKKLPVFVDGAMPPEEVIVKITESHQRYAKGIVSRIRIKAQQRVKPVCKHYEECGGCQLQHVAYEEQLLFKEELLEEAVEKYANLSTSDFMFNDIVGMDKPLNYRMKSQMPVKNTKKGLRSGLYKKGSTDLVLIDDCPVQDPMINDINNAVLKICTDFEVNAFDPKTMRGMLRYIVIRKSQATKEVQVTLVITIFNKVLLEVAKEIMKLPLVVSVGISKNKDKANHEIFGEDVEILEGKNYIIEGINDTVYHLKPKAFYQLNPTQAKKLYSEVETLIDPTTDKIIVDAYSGAGAIGLYLAKKVQKVVGIDVSKESIFSAKHNVKQNNLTNIEYHQGEVKDVLKKLYNQSFEPDVLIFDPPRSGLDEDTIDLLLRKPMKKVIYISCNPATLAKNIKSLSRKYKVVSMTPYDMFPQTSQVESVTLLIAK